MYRNKIKNAFTILELAVVIVIIAILIFTTINYSNTMSVNAKNRLTKDKLKIIYLALGKYLTDNKKLPLPILLNTSKNKVMEVPGICVGDGNRCYGGVPVRDLGLSAELSEDGFGNKIFYMVNQNYAGIGAASNFGNYTLAGSRNLNNFTIKEKINDTSHRTITTNAIVVLSSSGANQAYAYRSKNHLNDCGAVPNCNYIGITSSNTSEQSNEIIVSPRTIFINDYTSPVFDDLVLYKTEEDFSLDFNQFYLQKCSANPIAECENLSYNLQKSKPCSTENISQRFKCYQSNNCRFLFDCRK